MNDHISGVVIRELKRFTDTRGWLIELFRRDELDPEYLPAMTYISMTKPGITRGPHEHADQADYFCFIGPSTFRLYLWDNRPSSPTYRLSTTCDLGENRPTAVIVPKGVVHAYKNVGSSDGIVFNAPNRLFAGERRKEPVDEIRHENDPDSRFKVEE
jgi:dTDP-4-dehydrorhamnose 3,5-epimerase